MGEESLNHIKDYLLQHRTRGCDPKVAEVVLGEILLIADNIKKSIIDASPKKTMMDNEQQKVQGNLKETLEIGKNEIAKYIESSLLDDVKEISEEFIKNDESIWRIRQSAFASEFTKYIQQNLPIYISNKMSDIINMMITQLKKDLAKYYGSNNNQNQNMGKANQKTSAEEESYWRIVAAWILPSLGGVGVGIGSAIEAGGLVAASVAFPPLAIGVAIGSVLAGLVTISWTKNETANEIIKEMVPKVKEYYKNEMESKCNTFFKEVSKIIFLNVSKSVQQEFEDKFKIIDEVVEKITKLELQ